jgi:hypothetical protein
MAFQDNAVNIIEEELTTRIEFKCSDLGGMYYEINNNGIFYDAHYPVPWALEDENNNYGKLSECNNCLYFGRIRGVVVACCSNCADDNGRRDDHHFQRGYLDVCLFSQEEMQRELPYMHGAILEQIGFSDAPPREEEDDQEEDDQEEDEEQEEDDQEEEDEEEEASVSTHSSMPSLVECTDEEEEEEQYNPVQQDFMQLYPQLFDNRDYESNSDSEYIDIVAPEFYYDAEGELQPYPSRE